MCYELKNCVKSGIVFITNYSITVKFKRQKRITLMFLFWFQVLYQVMDQWPQQVQSDRVLTWTLSRQLLNVSTLWLKFDKPSSKYTLYIVSLKQLLNVSTLWLKIHSLYCESQTVVVCQYTMTQNTLFILWVSNSCCMSVHYDSKYTLYIVSLKQLLNVSTLWLKIHSLYCESQTVVECQYTMTQNTLIMLWVTNSC